MFSWQLFVFKALTAFKSKGEALRSKSECMF